MYLTEEVNKLEGEGEQLTRSTRGAGLSREVAHNRSCSAHQEFALAGKESENSVGSNLSQIVEVLGSHWSLYFSSPVVFLVRSK